MHAMPILENCFDKQAPLDYNTVMAACKAPISQLNISRRSVNGLYSADVKTVADLAAMTAKELLEIRYFGDKCLSEVQDALKEFVYSV